MREPAPNPYRSHIHTLPAPMAWTSKQARFLAECIRLHPSLADITAAKPEETTSIHVCMIRLGEEEENVMRQAKWGLAKARAQLDKLERELEAYGAKAVMPGRFPIVAPHPYPEDDQETYLIRWLRELGKAGLTIVYAGSVRLIRDESRAYRRAPEHQEA